MTSTNESFGQPENGAIMRSIAAVPPESCCPPSASCRRCGRADPGGQCPGCGLFQPGNGIGRRFEAGNTLQLAHGARQGEALEQATREALTGIEAVLDGGPGSELRYALARGLAAGALARYRLLAAHLERVGLLDGKSRVRPVVKTLAEASSAAHQWLSALGLSPAAASRLGVNLASTRRITLAEKLAAERKRPQ